MSEAAANLPTPQFSGLLFTPPKPEVWIGAASPLWAYFTGAAMLGVSWWWLSRWMQAPAMPAARLTPARAPTTALAVRALEPPPGLRVGGEAAPMSPAVAEPEARSAPAPVEPGKSGRKARSGNAEPRPH